MFIYENATALITGASKGLGSAFARELAKRGANLVLVARSPAALQELADSLHAQYGVECVVLVADLASPDAVKNIVSELEKRHVHVDLLINNAGLGLTGDFLSHDLGKELGSVQVNVQALVGLSHALGRKMLARGNGGIINLSSNSAFQPLPSMATYAAAKAFVLHFTEALRYELKNSGVHVMAVAPGPTATNFFEGVSTTMKSSTFDSAEDVVRSTLRSFDRRKSVAYPGRFSVRLATLLPRLLPRNAVAHAAASETIKMGLATRV
jgi:short-subunit dehydrogenase